MDTKYYLELAAPPDQELRDSLRDSGATLESALTGWALPLGMPVEALEADLRRRGVKYDLYTDLVPSGEDNADDLAAYLPLAALADAAPPGDGELVMLRDEDRHGTVASVSLIERLDEVTTGLEWVPVEGGDPLLRRLVGVPELPDPVAVPRGTVGWQATDDGTWAVSSDGAELLTPASLDVVRRHGLAIAPACEVDGKILRWRRPVIASGRVLDLLNGLDMRGRNGEPVYLGG
jgi:hypothetical protein